MMSENLKASQREQGHEMSDVQAVAGGVETTV